jgi:glycosyltransferase involved in cell wall biosynthesis
VKVLLVVPLPPPVTGHSLASQVLLDGLTRVHDTTVVDLSVGSLNDGRVTMRRLYEVVKVVRRVWHAQRSADAIYFTISESKAGNLKDVLIYLACAGRLRRLFVHLHGGTIGRELFDRHPWWRAMNAIFIARVGGVIISGKAHLDIFSGMIPRERIHMVPNGAQEELFVPEEDVEAKFADISPLRVLYLSTMAVDKGYRDLADAWFQLSPATRDRVHIDFAGRFETETDQRQFEARIAGVKGIRYHGLVSPEEKRRLLKQAHVFCLPTRMFEGQPISILEAYASGCAVLTTAQRGILDVFADTVNGFEVAVAAPDSIATALSRLPTERERLREIAIGNRRSAGERYRTSTYITAIRHILEVGAAS